MQVFTHYFLHLVFPLAIAWIFFRSEWKKAYLILLLTILVDLDHLLATPIFQADRCSIGFHPLHSYYAMAGYVVLLFFRRPFNIIGIGLLFHMFTDLIDCLFTFSHCQSCLADSPIYSLLAAISNFVGLN
ncbi:DUF6122 family protein [Sunxiuqinia indica]|uniref:DUF6122 family protein n=1 Tax=Sunxiuqinia indica TaxID=2692584 RepID=UPI00135AEA16|nr:DUF6122 family protein [Sunxiuqinia indica]